MNDPTQNEIVGRSPEALDVSREPPVVARLVVEIRSDGTTTIARGALEDAALGRKVAIEAKGRTPLSLALSLAKSLFHLPSLARAASSARGLLPGRKPSE